MASPICFETVFRSALSASPSPRSRRRVGPARAPVDERRVLALVDRALADDVGLVAEPLQADAHAAPPDGRRAGRLPGRSMTNPGSRLASSQPARGPFGRPRNRQVDRLERPPRRELDVPRDREDERSATRRRRRGRRARRHRTASRGTGAARRRGRRPPRERRPVGRRSSRSRGRRPRASARAACTRSSRIARSRSVSGLPFSASTRAATSTPGIWTSRARCENAGRKSAASAATSASGSSNEYRNVASCPGGSSPLTSRPAVAAANLSNSSKRRGIASVPSGSNSIAWFGRGRRNRKRSCSGGMTSTISWAAAPRPLEVDIFLPPMLRNSYGDVERRLALEHLAGDRIAAVARAAGGREVLAAGLDGHAEQRPLGRPLEVPGQLRRPAERARSSPDAPQPCAHVTRSWRHS